MNHTMVDTVKKLYPSSSIWTKKCRTTTTALIAYMMSLVVWAKTADTYYYTSAFSPTRYASHSLSAATRVGNASCRYNISRNSSSNSSSSNIDNDLRKEPAATTAVPVNPVKIQQEFDIDSMMTLEELNELSMSIGGPVLIFNDNENDKDEDNNDTILEDAKDRLWDYVEGTAENDIDQMCMGQLTGVLVELLGKDTLREVEDYLVTTNISTLKEVRNLAWDLSSSRSSAP